MKIGAHIVKVLIVGAGPTGLTLAACLEKFGISPDIVDFKDCPNDQSKALAINPVAQAQLGIIFGKNDVGKNSNIVTKLKVIFNTDKRLTTINLKHLEWPCNSMLVQSQYDTEKDLIELAKNNNVNVQWGTRVVEVIEHDDAVQVAFEGSDNQTIKQQYDYVIGCEGKHSLVREAIGATMTPLPYSMYLALADFKLDVDLSEDSAYYFVYEETFFVFVPLGKSIWRIVVKHNGDPKRGEYINLVTDPVLEKFGRNIFCGECLWFSQAPLYVSYANKLQSKRLFIAGDSAHLFSPISGTGMNTGIVDAVNLAWKIAFTIKGNACGNTLIQSYQEERIPAIKENAMATDRLTKLISRQEEHTDQFMPKMSNRAYIRNLFPLNVSGFGFSYQSSSVLFGMTDDPGIGRMDAKLTKLLMSSAEFVSNFSLYINVLQFMDQDIHKTVLPCPKQTKLKGVRDVVVQWISNDEAVNSSVIKVQQSPNTINIGLLKKDWQELCQLGDLQVLRPDGVVVFRGSIEEHGEVIINLSKYLNFQ